MSWCVGNDGGDNYVEMAESSQGLYIHSSLPIFSLPIFSLLPSSLLSSLSLSRHTHTHTHTHTDTYSHTQTLSRTYPILYLPLRLLLSPSFFLSFFLTLSIFVLSSDRARDNQSGEIVAIKSVKMQQESEGA